LPAKLDGKISAIKNALLKGSAKYGISLGGEILEEELQNFLEPAFRTIIFGEKYDMPTVQELIDTALVTALSTSAIEGPEIASETIKEHSDNNTLETATNSVQPEQSSPNAPETIDVGKIGWDGRVAVTEATGPKVTVGGKTYELIGYDKDGAKVYQDVEVLESAKENATADQKETNPTESGLESVENPENRDTIEKQVGYGAYTDKNDPLGKERERVATEYYEQIRNRDRNYEIADVSKNTGFSIREVDVVFSHIFEKEHLFEDGEMHRFHPDYYMQHSWMRLREGKNIQPHDIILLNHELLEASIMEKDPNITYEKAHEEACKKYDYKKALLEYLKDHDA